MKFYAVAGPEWTHVYRVRAETQSELVLQMVGVFSRSDATIKQPGVIDKWIDAEDAKKSIVMVG